MIIDNEPQGEEYSNPEAVGNQPVQDEPNIVIDPVFQQLILDCKKAGLEGDNLIYIVARSYARGVVQAYKDHLNQ